MIRALLVFALIALPIALSYSYAEHHEGSGIFETLFMHVMPAALENNHETIVIPLPGFLSIFSTLESGIHIYNLQLFQIAAVLLILVCFSGVPGCIRSGKGDYISRLFSGFCLWIRDEMVIPIMGRQYGTMFLPLFLTLFFFILFMNLLGMVPGGATATANAGTTGALAILTFVFMIGGGMVVQGPFSFWKNLIPHGLPMILVPLLFVVEIIGLIVKPVALTIRLFANMTAGHLIVLSSMGLIFIAGEAGASIGYGAAPLAVGFAVFIMIIEAFVACLQAYIFTYLSILFVQMSIHPEH